MPRPLLVCILLAACVATALAVAPGGAPPRPGDRPEAPGRTSFSAGVAPAGSELAAAGANWGNRSAAASADPARWGQVARDAAARRRQRVALRRRLARLVVDSAAERLGVRPARLRAAVRTVARERAGAGLPAGPERAALRDELATDLGRELGVPPARVLAAARAELASRLANGADRGIVTAAARRRALRCFDAPGRCDVRRLRRDLRYAHLLGR